VEKDWTCLVLGTRGYQAGSHKFFKSLPGDGGIERLRDINCLVNRLFDSKRFEETSGIGR
jgi:hypothetical protein